jgi:hypothetical protein
MYVSPALREEKKNKATRTGKCTFGVALKTHDVCLQRVLNKTDKSWMAG